MAPETHNKTIGAIVLAAGRSSRMGANKLLLPLGSTTVIERVVGVMAACQLAQVIVVTGHEREKIASALRAWRVRFVHNADYARAEMLSSVQTGLRAIESACQAALIAPGDQPLIEAHIVNQVIQAGAPGRIVIPAFHGRGGHPVLIDRAHWLDILWAPPHATLRDIIHSKPQAIHYVDVESETVLQDMDTPDQYQAVLKSLGEQK